jgi:hypothetical protein
MKSEILSWLQRRWGGFACDAAVIEHQVYEPSWKWQKERPSWLTTFWRHVMLRPSDFSLQLRSQSDWIYRSYSETFYKSCSVGMEFSLNRLCEFADARLSSQTKLIGKTAVTLWRQLKKLIVKRVGSQYERERKCLWQQSMQWCHLEIRTQIFQALD